MSISRPMNPQQKWAQRLFCNQGVGSSNPSVGTGTLIATATIAAAATIGAAGVAVAGAMASRIECAVNDRAIPAAGRW